MKLKENALSRSTQKGTSLRQFVRNSQTGCIVVDCLSSDTTEEAIVETLRALFDVPAETVTADVSRILEELRRLDALVE